MAHAVLKKVPGDGSCFYHAVIAGYNRRNVDASRLRNMVANVYSKIINGTNKKLQKEYESLLLYYANEQDVSPATYANQTRSCMWAGPLEVELLSKVLKRRIAVYNRKDLKGKKKDKCVYNLDGVEPLLDFGDKRRNPIMVVVSGYKPSSNAFGTHYDALIPVKYVR